ITTLIPQFILGPNSLITSVAFPASAIFGGATISLLVSIIAGGIPAALASRVDMAYILRE
ncbi:MAG: hypothetical protein LBI63_06120, partial [Candidatus Ancillula sp.]|nr:hypothetical protein [Candidatus Ancillula sp.]